MERNIKYIPTINSLRSSYSSLFPLNWKQFQMFINYFPDNSVMRFASTNSGYMGRTHELAKWSADVRRRRLMKFLATGETHECLMKAIDSLYNRRIMGYRHWYVNNPQQIELVSVM